MELHGVNMELEPIFNLPTHALLGWLPENGVSAELQIEPSRAHTPARGSLLISVTSRAYTSRTPHTWATARLRSRLQPPSQRVVLGLHEIMSMV